MQAVARLRNDKTSARKMRLVADLIRGQKVSNALNVLKFEKKHGAARMEKLLLSAIANWQNKFEDEKLEEADLFIKEIRVDGGRMLKRIQPAPQGRAHRIRKRSNHVTLIVEGQKKAETKGSKEQAAEAKAPVKKTKPKKKEPSKAKKTATTAKKGDSGKKTPKAKKGQKSKPKTTKGKKDKK